MRIFSGHRLSKPFTAALVAALLPVGACKKDEPAPPATADAAATTPPEAPSRLGAGVAEDDLERGRPRAGLEAPPPSGEAPSGLFASQTLGLVPDNALAAFVFRVEAISQAIGLGDLLAGSADEEIQGIRTNLMQALGGESLDRDAFAKAGIKPDSDLGIGLLSIDSDAFVITVEMSDRAAFMNTFDAFGGRGGLTPVTETRGDYTLVTMKENTMGALVVSATHATFFGTNYLGDAVALAKAAIDSAGAGRLASSPAFQKATKDATGAALGVYLSPAYIALVTDGRTGNDTWLGLANGVGLGVTLDAGNLALTASLPLDAEAPLAAALKPTKVFAAQKIVSPNTLVGFGASFHPDKLLRFALALAGAEDELASELKAATREFMNIDLDKDIIAKLTGEFGLAIDGPAPSAGAATIRVAELKGAAMIGVQPTAELGQLLAALPGSRAMEGANATWDEATAQITIPTNIGPILASADAGAVVITNDAEYLKANERQPQPLIGGAAVTAALAAGDVAAFVVGSSLILQPLMGDLFSQRDMGLWAPPPEDDDANEETKKLWNALNEAYEAALTEVRGDVETHQARQAALMRDVGTATFLLKRAPAGIQIQWQQTLRPGVSLPDLLARGLGFLSQRSDAAEDTAVSRYNALRDAFRATEDDGGH